MALGGKISRERSCCGYAKRVSFSDLPRLHLCVKCHTVQRNVTQKYLKSNSCTGIFFQRNYLDVVLQRISYLHKLYFSPHLRGQFGSNIVPFAIHRHLSNWKFFSKLEGDTSPHTFPQAIHSECSNTGELTWLNLWSDLSVTLHCKVCLQLHFLKQILW